MGGRAGTGGTVTARTPEERAAQVSLIRAAHARVTARNRKPAPRTVPEFGPFGILAESDLRRVRQIDRAEAAQFEATDDAH